MGVVQKSVGGGRVNSFLPILLLFTICLPPGVADTGGRIQGMVVDPGFASIANAMIRMMPGASGTTKYRILSDGDGRFHWNSLEPGSYRIAVSAKGFRERFINNVVIREDTQLDLGQILLLLAGCEAPGIICDSFSDEPVLPKLLSRGYLHVSPGCAVDVDEGKLVCAVVRAGPPASRPLKDRVSDFWLHADGLDGVYLESRNGAWLSEPDSAGVDCAGALFDKHNVRVDGLGSGSDLCVRTNRGHVSHIFFTGEVEPGINGTTIYYSTSK